jgi:hypothetical protein
LTPRVGRENDSIAVIRGFGLANASVVEQKVEVFGSEIEEILAMHLA